MASLIARTNQTRRLADDAAGGVGVSAVMAADPQAYHGLGTLKATMEYRQAMSLAPLLARLVLFACLVHLLPGPVRAGPAGLPGDFPLSPVTWGGLGGVDQRASCPPLRHHPVILVHDGGEGPERWYEGPDGGLAGALERAGFGACEVWALRAGQAGRPQRSLEELTDDLAFFITSVMAYTAAPRVQLLAVGDSAALTHTTLAKYRLHPLIHAAVYVDAPFQGDPSCDQAACFGGEIRCCSLTPGSLMLRRALLPLETPQARLWDPDQGPGGHLRYLSLGSSPAAPLHQRGPEAGAWMLDGAANLSFPALASQPLHRVEPAWATVVELLSDPAAACDPSLDGDGDGFCDHAHGGADCDDADPSVHPGAEEIEADGVDQNCNGHDVDRRFPGWACERPIGEASATAPPVPEPHPPRDNSWRWALGALVLLLIAGVIQLLGRRGRGSAALLLALLVGGRPAEAQAPTRLAPLPAELRLGILFEAADGDLDAALERCSRGDPRLEPMPDRHPHAEPEGAHYQDLGFFAPEELDEPFRSILVEMDRRRQGCARIDTATGPAILVRFEGTPASPWSGEQQRAWSDRQERLRGAHGMLEHSLPAAAATRGLSPTQHGAGKPQAAPAPVEPGVHWVGHEQQGTRRPVQIEAGWMDPEPVSADAFRMFALTADYEVDSRVTRQGLYDPAALVDLVDAWAYCRWVGGHLPSIELLEAQASLEASWHEWSASAWDGERALQLGDGEIRAVDWRQREGQTGFRCAYASPVSPAWASRGSSAHMP
jgi:hypothetical protein